MAAEAGRVNQLGHGKQSKGNAREEKNKEGRRTAPWNRSVVHGKKKDQELAPTSKEIQKDLCSNAEVRVSFSCFCTRVGVCATVL